ncbi:MAG TPA: GNAT family N-acetyltransferase [Candidatus Methylomirabilis sp.]
MTGIRAVVRGLRPGEAAGCESLLRSLPDWFGIEQAILDYRRDIESMDTWVADREGELAGFLTLTHHNPHTSEIRVMAVRADLHGKGVGRTLVRHAEHQARARGSRFLEVKTLGPSRPNLEYERTRKFYEAVGFEPLEENLLWGDANPCLILVKHLACSRER